MVRLPWKEFQFRYKCASCSQATPLSLAVHLTLIAFLPIRTKAAKSPVYPSVLSIGQSDPSAIYLDLGCFTGTDSRKLVADGWPAERVLGSDLRPEWFELGYKLYGDKGQCGVTFVAGDVFDDDFLAVEAGTAASSAAAPDLGSLHSLNALRGRVRCISAFSFFHLFDREPQLALARKLAVLLGPHPKPGSVIFGSHQGMRVPGNRRAPGQATLFGHSPDSWAEMWECEVFPASRDASAAAVGGGVKVKVWAELKDDGLPKMDVPGWRGENGQPMSSLMQWSVTVV